MATLLIVFSQGSPWRLPDRVPSPLSPVFLWVFPLMTSLCVLLLFASERHSCMLKCHLKEGYIVSPILASSFCSQGTAFTLLNIIYQWLTHNMQCITPCVYFPSWPLWISLPVPYCTHTERECGAHKSKAFCLFCVLSSEARAIK